MLKELQARLDKYLRRKVIHPENIPPEIIDTGSRNIAIWGKITSSTMRYKGEARLPNDFTQHYVRNLLFPIVYQRSEPDLESAVVSSYLISKLAEGIEITHGVPRLELQSEEPWLDKQLNPVKEYMAEAYPTLKIPNISGSSLISEIQSMPITVDNNPRKVKMN